ncbi:MAG: DNA polymerase III subunit beta [Candidatus Melainabacteria bacterium]
MKFSVQREIIHQAVNAVQRATATRVIQPILSNILVESVEDNTLRLSATDMDFAIETTVPATILVSGQITLSAKKLSEILNKLPNGVPVTVDANLTTQTAHLECGNSVFDMRTLPAEEFPAIKQIDQPGNTLTVSFNALQRAINQTVFAAASYDANNVLGGVFFRLSKDGLEMAATDGSRLARRQEPIVGEGGPEGEVSAIIPAKTLQEFLKLNPAGPDETVKLAIQDGQIAFRTQRYYVLSRLLDGQYPKYNQLIPLENKLVAHAKRQTFIESLERAAVMANERTNIVKLAFENGHLSLAANTPDVGDAKDTMAVLYDGTEPLNIAFNYKYVLDALRVIESDDVRMETNGALAPTLFKGDKDDEYLCLVMPVQVK